MPLLPKLETRIKESAAEFTKTHFGDPAVLHLVEQAMVLAANIALVYPQRYPICDSKEHVAKEIPGNYYARDKFRSDSAKCIKCDSRLGWYCPKAPNHYCEYDWDKDPCGDSCLHCGMPDERK